MYEAALQSTSPQLVQLFQVIIKFSYHLLLAFFTMKLSAYSILFHLFPFLIDNLHLM